MISNGGRGLGLGSLAGVLAAGLDGHASLPVVGEGPVALVLLAAGRRVGPALGVGVAEVGAVAEVDEFVLQATSGFAVGGRGGGGGDLEVGSDAGLHGVGAVVDVAGDGALAGPGVAVPVGLPDPRELVVADLESGRGFGSADGVGREGKGT